MPLFPELEPYLKAVLDELLVDFDPKQKRLSEQPVITRYRETNANLRTQLCKIIRAPARHPGRNFSKIFAPAQPSWRTSSRRTLPPTG